MLIITSFYYVFGNTEVYSKNKIEHKQNNDWANHICDRKSGRFGEY